MPKNARARQRRPAPLAKSPTGIPGLDHITNGGLPRGRATLVCGAAGSGKTLLAMEFLVRGIAQYGESGVFMSFEETGDELAANVASLDFDLRALQSARKLVIDYVQVARHEIEETGEYDLEGLFVRLGSAIDAVGAKRVVLDSVETLFGGLSNSGILRAELRRLFRWLKDRGVTAVITGERGEGTLTRHGLEEYISDCVILLDNRIADQIATRRLRVVKYRGSVHGPDEYPFLLDDRGMSVLPATALTLDFPVSSERVSTGVAGLDAMLGDRGYYRGSSVLVSGAAGTGKTSFAASFAVATCRAGERCLYLALEEAEQQLARNMRSIGVDLHHWRQKGLLRISASRPSLLGLELRLLNAHQLVQQFQPSAVVVDPISNFIVAGTARDTRAMLTRLLDFLKAEGITTLFTSLSPSGQDLEQPTNTEVSSLIDTWLLLRDVESAGERSRALTIVKSRGMSHSKQTREFVFTPRGIELLDVQRDEAGAVTGAARERHAVEVSRRRAQRERKRVALEAQIDALRASFDAEEAGEATTPRRRPEGARRRP